MRRRELLKSGAGISFLSATAGCIDAVSDVGGRGTPEATYGNPVFEPIFADPTVLRTDDGTFYAYATQDNWHDGEGFRLVPILRSTDLVEWEYVGEAFAEKPTWKSDGFLWAPDINYYRDKYYLYYSYSLWGDENPGIGLATADSPEGPFTDQGKLFTSEEIGVTNSIDPMLYVQDGTPYLFWGSFHGIYAVELTPDGTGVAGEKTHIAGDAYEGTYVVERDGSYYFFGSAGTCCDGTFSTYHVQVGRSDSLLGPYVDRDGNDLRNTTGPTILDDGNGFVAPGHVDVIRADGDRDWLLYHAYEEGEGYIRNTPRRVLMLDPLQWEDGWPTVEGQAPSTSAHVPRIDG